MFENEVKLLNIIFKKFNETQIKLIENNIDKKYELNAYLISLELALRDLYNNLLTINNLTPDEKFNLDDGIKVSTGSVISYLMDFKKCKINLNCFIEEKHIKLAAGHIRSATNKNFLKNVKDLWCYYDISIKEIENIIYIRNTSLLGLGKNLTQLTFLDMRNAKMHAHSLEQYHRNNRNLNQLDTLDTEELSKKFLYEELFIDNLNTEINNIPLEYYIKAYSTISKIAADFIHNSKTSNSSLYKLEDFCLVKDKNNWKIIFEENGIPSKYIDGIIKFLIFNKKSRDLMDSPFLCFENKIIIVPSVMLGLDASRTTLLNASAKGLDIRFKGDYLESFIHDTLKSVNIEVIKLKKVVSNKIEKTNKTFECDAVFKIDNTLYFLEIKHWFVPITYRDFALYLDELEETNIQLNRIVDFYSREEQLNEITKKLNCSKPHKIKKIILTNIPYSGVIKFEDTIITDTIIFEGYFKRRPPNRIEYNNEEIIIQKLYGEYYQGEISAFQFEALLRDIPMISDQASRIYLREYKTNFGINLNIEDYYFETYMSVN